MTLSRILLAILTLLGGGRSPQESPDLRRYTVDRAASRLFVVTRKEGLLSFLGHEHAIVPGEWTAELCLADPVPGGARASVVVRTSSLVIDSDSARALAGLGSGPDEEQRREVRRKMLGEGFLAAGTHPDIRLDLRAPTGESDGVVPVRGSLSVRGTSRDIQLPVTVRREGDALRLGGVVRVLQSDFGIEPESVAGVVKVSDGVELHVDLLARPTAETCPSGGPPR